MMNAMLNINIVKIMNICNVSDKLEFGRTELNRSIPNCMVACIRARFDDIRWNNESNIYIQHGSRIRHVVHWWTHLRVGA
jgi:hypothetical protein